MAEFKYIFKCIFDDGSVLYQDKDDKPKFSKTGSSFTDVKQRIDSVRFFALQDLQGNTVASVDLYNGKFTVGNIPFSSPETPISFSSDIKFRLIYFRRTRQHTGLINDPIEYHIGWQATYNGQNYQQTIFVT